MGRGYQRQEQGLPFDQSEINVFLAPQWPGRPDGCTRSRQFQASVDRSAEFPVLGRRVR